MQTVLTIDDIFITLIRENTDHVYVRLLSNGTFQVFAPHDFPEHALVDMVKENLADFKIQRNKWLNRRKDIDVACSENLEDILIDRLGVLIPECEKIVGAHASAYQLKNMTSRWGSCSQKTEKITLNLKLTGMDDETLKMVVIHELVHFYTQKHGTEFKAYMDRFCPDWRQISDKLKGRNLLQNTKNNKEGK